MALDEERLRTQFSAFISAHPHSLLTPSAGDESGFVIEKPWGDVSLELVVPPDPASLAGAINSVILPEQFSAIWHRDTKKLEVAWTAFALGRTAGEVKDRSFTFNFNEVEYKCSYSKSSDRLLEIARCIRPVRASTTSYRNMQPFQMYVSRDETTRAIFGDPLSFWIENIEWNEDWLLNFAYHLNFYMSYFDDRSPRMIIHPPAIEDSAKPRTRYISGKFPTKILTKSIDLNVLQFWEAGLGGDPARQFLYFYRIVEYMALFYLDSLSRTAVRKALSVPNALDDLQKATENVLSALHKSKLQDDQRIDHMLRDVVDPALLWSEIENNLTSLTGNVVFDGGFTLTALVAIGTTGEQFAVNGISNFARAAKEIRNALSHGRDLRTSAVIAPTHRNFTLLRPWVCLMSVAAAQVILYNDAL